MGSPLAGQPLGGRWRRLFAGLLDGFIVSAVTASLTWSNWQYVWDGDGGFWERYPYQSTFVAAAIAFLYYWLFQAYWYGQTPGKRLFHLRVIQENGRPATPGQIAIRQFVEILLASLCFFGLVDLAWILFDPRKQALHDKVARTLVVDA